MNLGTTAIAIEVRRSATRHLFYDAALPDDLIQALWQRPERLISCGRLLRDKSVRRTSVFRWGDRRFVIKHYVESSWWQAVKHSFGRSRAWRAWLRGHSLADADIATPRPVACVENPIGRLRRDSYFMYPFVEGITLETYFQQVPAPRMACSIWEQLQNIWKKLRLLQISLTDTHARNFIMTAAGKVAVIDIDDTRFHHSALTTAHYQSRAWKRLVRSIPPNCTPAALAANQECECVRPESVGDRLAAGDGRMTAPRIPNEPPRLRLRRLLNSFRTESMRPVISVNVPQAAAFTGGAIQLSSRSSSSARS